jgi:hypothetical protein
MVCDFLFCIGRMQSGATLRNGQLPAPGGKVKRKVRHTSRFTAVKDSRNRKVRGPSMPANFDMSLRSWIDRPVPGSLDRGH